ncbi:MAG: anti-sigma F factor [Lachnospiraceae bacterium]|nr:anti-sigma F factor [Ruminococcus sp.]MCM1274392.1 anti-sigma F factor [Lachnospiraceae bacterium]
MKRNSVNECKVRFPALSRNEGLSRSAAAAFAMQCDPTVEEIAAIKTAVSEAVTNAIVHGYRDTNGEVELFMRLYSDNAVYIRIKDNGKGISDVRRAMEPAYTTAPADEERSGLGFTVMESFMDKVRVRSSEGRGTVVTMEKKIAGRINDKR